MPRLPKIDVCRWEFDFEARMDDWAFPLRAWWNPICRGFSILCFTFEWLGIERPSDNEVEEAIDLLRETEEMLSALHEHLHEMRSHAE